MLDIQQTLWNAGLVRAAGAQNIVIADYAIVNDATVLTADHDFDHIASVTELLHEYIQPTDGSIAATGADPPPETSYASCGVKRQVPAPNDPRGSSQPTLTRHFA